MKLLRLKLNESFRSLPEGFEIHFLRDWEFGQMWEFGPYCLAGVNGSGKSNMLEALAAIFYHLDCMNLSNLPENFETNEEEGRTGFMVEKCIPDAFELEYLLPVRNAEREIISTGKAVVQKEGGKAPVFLWNDRFDADHEAFEPLESKERRRDKLPSHVVGYSSGENEVLSLPFFKMRFLHFDEYNDGLKNQTGYDLSKQPEGRLIYLDNHFSQAILLCTMLFAEQDAEHKDVVLEIFEKVIGIKAVEEFRIIIRKKVDEESFTLLNLSESDKEDPDKSKRHITQYLEDAIESLRSCATCWQYEEQTDTLTLDYFVNDATRAAFRHYFGDALTLFRRFQLLLTLNLYRVGDEAKRELYQSESLYVNETVPVLASDERIMQFNEVYIRKASVPVPILLKSLSDGEHQFMHTIGLCLLFRDENALFLLDEPETHLNPDWRAKYISTLRDCLKGPEVMRDILLTSHSPFIISDCQKEKVLIFKRPGEGGSQSIEKNSQRPEGFETFGASVNFLTFKIFGKQETISNLAKERIEDIKNSFESGEITLDEAIDRTYNEIGDSIERLMLLKSMDTDQNQKEI